jgi:hypothetical protein
METIELTSKLLANATGMPIIHLLNLARDKINRFVQYYCRFLLWIGEKNGTSADRLERLKGLMVTLNISHHQRRPWLAPERPGELENKQNMW